MPVPSPGQYDVHINGLMTEMSLGWPQLHDSFVADRTFQVISSKHRSDNYLRIPPGEWNRNQMQERAPATESAGSNYKIDTTPTFYCRRFSLHHDIPDEIDNDKDDPIDLDLQANYFLTSQALINREVAWVNAYFKTGVWTAFDLDGVSSAGSVDATHFLQYNQTDSDFLAVIRRYITDCSEKYGRRLNCMTMGQRVWDVVIDHPDLVGRIDRGQTQGVAGAPKVIRDALAMLLEIQEVNVMSGIVNNAIPGAADSQAFIGGKHLLLSYKPPVPGRLTPASGYTFVWQGDDLQNNERGWALYDLPYEARRKCRSMEIESFYDLKQVEAGFGVFFENAVS